MPDFLLWIATDALIAGSAVAVYLFCIRPQLAWRRARPLAFQVAAAAALAVPALLAVDAFVPVPSVIFLAPTVILASVWISPDELVGLTGGPRPLASDVEAAFSVASEAWDRYEIGDIDGAAEAVGRLNAMRAPAIEGYINLWQRFIAEEQSRRAGARQSSRGTLAAIHREAARLTTLDTRPGTRVAWAAVGLAALIGASPAIVASRACIGVEQLLPASAVDDGTAGGQLPVLPALKSQPETGAVLVYDASWDLDAAAEALHDPDTREQLLDAGFVGAHATIWRAPDGHQLSANVFVFGDASGALRFQRNVNRHACQFSSEAFAGPASGVGLQVRRSTGDPIVEQISWVSGHRRYVVSVGAPAPPPDHSRVERLAEHVLRDVST